MLYNFVGVVGYTHGKLYLHVVFNNTTSTKGFTKTYLFNKSCIPKEYIALQNLQPTFTIKKKPVVVGPNELKFSK